MRNSIACGMVLSVAACASSARVSDQGMETPSLECELARPCDGTGDPSTGAIALGIVGVLAALGITAWRMQ